MKKKRVQYTGVLAEPFELCASLPADSHFFANVARTFDVPVDRVMSDWHKAFYGDLDLIECRIRALYDHFEIDRNDTEPARTLALSLAARHERDILYQGPRMDYGALCTHFETVDADELVWKLATKHVPGFKPVASKHFRGKLKSSELVKLLFAAYVVKGHCQRSGRIVSDRQVVEILVDEKMLQRVLPPDAARDVQSVLLRTGNNERECERGLKSRERYVRYILSKARNAWADLIAGCANDLQRQLIVEVFPLLRSLTADGAGQTNFDARGRI